MYFVIHNSDGDTTVDTYESKEKLEEDINNHAWGEETEFIDDSRAVELVINDTNYWGDKILIIKGAIVAPRSVKIIKNFEID